MTPTLHIILLALVALSVTLPAFMALAHTRRTRTLMRPQTASIPVRRD